MRVLCVLNGPIVGTSRGRERRVNRHTARFLLELRERLGEVVVASPLVDLGQAGNLSDFDLAAHPTVRIATCEWPSEGVARRVLSYVRALPWVWRETRGADLTYVFLPGNMSFLFVVAAWLLRKPYAVYLRGSLGMESRHMRRAIRHASFVLGATQLLADDARCQGADAEVVTPMIDLTLADVADQVEVADEPPYTLLFVGRIEAAKGLPELLEALGALRKRGVSFRLELAGTGPEIDRYRAEAAAQGLPDAIFHGMISDPERLKECFTSADLLLLPTHHEGFPRVLYEAMTQGVPVATTFVGGIPGVMRDGENCVRLPLRDAEQLAAVVEKILGDRDRRRSIAEGGLRTMRDILRRGRPSHAAQVQERLAR